MKKKKVYVIMVSKAFPKDHPRAGEQTNFIEQINNAFHPNKPSGKIHTIRGNYELWKKRIDSINKGEAVLSLRSWTAKPDRPKQAEFAEFSSVGIQKVQILNTKEEMQITVDEETPVWVSDVAKNDGLSPSDFSNWFFPSDKIKKYSDCVFDGAIIHLSDFRY